MSGLRRIGSRYQVESLLGRGSTGQVWLGRDEQGNPFAFKVLRPELAEDSCVVHQFMQERSVLQSIRHPNVVGVHDLVVEGSTLAIVMDLVEGSDLRTLLAVRGTLPPVEVARCGARLAGALGAAHDAGIAHRDLKPENVLVEAATGEVRLTDFGIAELMDASSTTPERVAGTPQYMAPEVADGYVGGHAGDLYSLGVMMYELCSGVTPFAGRGSALATMKAHASDVPRRPDGIPDGLWAVISELLAKSPEDRPASASVLEARLRALEPLLVNVPAAERLSASGEATSSGAVADDRTVWGVSSGRAALPAAPVGATDDEWGDDGSRRRGVLVAAAAGLVIAGGALAWVGLPGRPSESVGEAPVRATPTSTTDRSTAPGLAASSAPVVSPTSVPPLAEVTVVPPGAGAPGVVTPRPGGGSGTAIRGHRPVTPPPVGRAVPPLPTRAPAAPTSAVPTAPAITNAPDLPTETLPPAPQQSDPPAGPPLEAPPVVPPVAPPAATEQPAAPPDAPAR